MNVDGAVKHNSTPSCGGVIKDSRGCWVEGFSKYIDRCRVEVADMWTVLEV